MTSGSAAKALGLTGALSVACLFGSSAIAMLGCAGTPRAKDQNLQTGSAEKPPTSAPPPPTEKLPAVPNREQPHGSPCNVEIPCQLFESPEEAFAEVLERRPRVLALGEAHAQKTAPNVSSATTVFGERLLPMLGERVPHASDLVVELVATAGACDPAEQEVQRKVERELSTVSAPQAESNQSEFVALGHRAKDLGLTPWLLRPSCEELKQVQNAGPDGIQAMLELIRTLIQDRAEQLLVARPAPAMIVIYGGALHNDLVPREGREQWSFGPALDQKTGGQYVELDLIVPELIRDSDAWRSLPWVAHYDSARLAPFAVLFEPNPRAYVLVLPRSALERNDKGP